MIKPPIEELLKETPGRFALVITAARRARNINSYFNQLGEGIGAYTPPQVQQERSKFQTKINEKENTTWIIR